MPLTSNRNYTRRADPLVRAMALELLTIHGNVTRERRQQESVAQESLVLSARRAELTWEEIGAALGVTAGAVRQRYGSAADEAAGA